MTFTRVPTLLGVPLRTSKGAAGVTGSGFIVLAATLSAVSRVPVAGLAPILGIDRFISDAWALTDPVGIGIATVAAGTRCEEDRDRLRRVSNRETGAEADEPEAVLDRTTDHVAA